MTTKQPSTVVIGVGNTCRRDDGVGIAVLRRLQNRLSPGITIIEASGEGAALLDAWNGAMTAILVDAVHAGAPPGTIHRFDAQIGPIPSRFFQCSTHAFGVAEAVELARALNQLPPRLVVYGIEGKSFSAGLELSAEVEHAAAAVVAQVLNETRVLAKQDRGEGLTALLPICPCKNDFLFKPNTDTPRHRVAGKRKGATKKGATKKCVALGGSSTRQRTLQNSAKVNAQ